MFAKKDSWDQRLATEVGGAPPAAKAAGAPRYGIAEAIQLMRGLPVEQNSELVVRVVRATLASLDVRLPDIIEDASRKQRATQDRIADFHAKIAELEKQLESHRADIAALEADLKETTEVKERLQLAEAAVPPAPPATDIGRTTMIGNATAAELAAAPKL